MNAAVDSPTEKTCTRCGEIKPLSEFHKGNSRFGRQSNCKSCACARASDWYRSHKPRVRATTRAYYRRTRIRVLQHYSGGAMRCACCGEPTPEFLSLDHVDGGGRGHRRGLTNRRSYWAEFVKLGFPEGYQVLCHNCNQAKGYYGMCPHQRGPSD